MAIFFRCACGQDLRAHEEQAGGARNCPACGASVPVPSLAQANQHLGIAAQPVLDLLPARDRPAALAVPAPAPSCPVTPEISVYQLASQSGVDLDDVMDSVARQQARQYLARARRQGARRREATDWPIESFWFECLLYPMRAAPILAILAFGWAVWIAVVVVLLPEGWELAVMGPRLAVLLLPLFLLSGYTCAFCRCVLISARAGEAGVVRWPKGDVRQILRGGAACWLGFFAGPVVPVVVAFLFWLHSGDLLWGDVLILAELGWLALLTWGLALLAVEQSGRLRDANPAAVVRLAGRLGWHGWGTVLLAATGALLHVYLGLLALEELHRSLAGWLGLLWLAFTGPAWVVFLLRWHGLSQFRAQGGNASGGKGSASPRRAGNQERAPISLK